MRRNCKLFAACSKIYQPSAKLKYAKPYYYLGTLVVVTPKNTSVPSAAVGRPPREPTASTRPSRECRHEPRRRKDRTAEKSRRDVVEGATDRPAPAARRPGTDFRRHHPAPADRDTSAKSRCDLATTPIVGHLLSQT